MDAIKELKDHITAAKDEIIAEYRKDKRGPGRPSKDKKPTVKRGPKNTQMMKVERAAVISYLEIECHRTVDSCTPSDCHHVWNMPENHDAFEQAAKLSDRKRGYSDYTALYFGVIYYNDKRILTEQRRKAGIYSK